MSRTPIDARSLRVLPLETTDGLRLFKGRSEPTRAARSAIREIPLTLSEYNRAGHADYPHHPGSHFDCAACESTCYCVPDETTCVHCTIKAERKINRRAIRYIDRFSY